MKWGSWHHPYSTSDDVFRSQLFGCVDGEWSFVDLQERSINYIFMPYNVCADSSWTWCEVLRVFGNRIRDVILTLVKWKWVLLDACILSTLHMPNLNKTCVSVQIDPLCFAWSFAFLHILEKMYFLSCLPPLVWLSIVVFCDVQGRKVSLISSVNHFRLRVVTIV